MSTVEHLRTLTLHRFSQSTLKFINEDASSVHGVVRASSVFTSEGGEWKLGGFDILSSMNDDDAVIYVCIPRFVDTACY